MKAAIAVPPMKETINSPKLISTPILTAKLIQNNNKVEGDVVKALMEKTALREMAECIKEANAFGKCFSYIQLHMVAIKMLQLYIDAIIVRMSIL